MTTPPLGSETVCNSFSRAPGGRRAGHFRKFRTSNRPFSTQFAGSAETRSHCPKQGVHLARAPKYPALGDEPATRVLHPNSLANWRPLVTESQCEWVQTTANGRAAPSAASARRNSLVCARDDPPSSI